MRFQRPWKINVLIFSLYFFYYYSYQGNGSNLSEYFNISAGLKSSLSFQIQSPQIKTSPLTCKNSVLLVLHYGKREGLSISLFTYLWPYFCVVFKGSQQFDKQFPKSPTLYPNQVEFSLNCDRTANLIEILA